MDTRQNGGVREDGDFVADAGPSSEKGVRTDLAMVSDADIVSDSGMGDQEGACADADIAGNKAEGTDEGSLADFRESPDSGRGLDEQGELCALAAEGFGELPADRGFADGADEFVTGLRYVCFR
jgi:hypothetical protein